MDAKRTSQLWVSPFLNYELWKQSYKLWKLMIQIASWSLLVKSPQVDTEIGLLGANQTKSVTCLRTKLQV